MKPKKAKARSKNQKKQKEISVWFSGCATFPWVFFVRIFKSKNNEKKKHAANYMGWDAATKVLFYYASNLIHMIEEKEYINTFNS